MASAKGLLLLLNESQAGLAAAQGNGTADWGRGGGNGTDQERRHIYNFYAMLLTLLIFTIVFGNVLVCMAVSREKALQTTTNYLIVSLAVADLLVATLVMPWVVYLEVVGEWRFSLILCDVFVTLDVMMCTASILNLCAISIDRLAVQPPQSYSIGGQRSSGQLTGKPVGARPDHRGRWCAVDQGHPGGARPIVRCPLGAPVQYTAVAMPMLYNTRYSSKRRVTVMIGVVWVLSFAISCPLLFGLNNTVTREVTKCSIANPAFVVYSSIVSFYVPFIITLLVYVQIYVVLRRRRKRVATRCNSEGAERDPHPPVKNKCTHPEDVQLCTLIVKSNTSFPPNRKKVTLVKEAVVHPSEPDQVCFLAEPERTRPKNTLLGLQSVSLAPSRALPSGAGLPSPVEVPAASPVLNGHPRLKRAFEAPRTTGDGNEKPTLKSTVKGRLSQQKEKKATQMLAIVLGVFIICWLPFFITHILRVHCLQCYISPELYSTATWLGYVNSAVNPIIYTTFNVEFRKAFIKILHC
ncbi:DRD2A protein, partial [Polyodon spathula]|nr:DRD2A protein [Polyodon spathula]